jgi:hypothetical protein
VLPSNKAILSGAGASIAAEKARGRTVTVDAGRHTGYENAVYAPTRRTVFVAYKRFLRSPYNPGGDYVPAQLRVAKSKNGGRSWSVDIVDPEAIESGDVIDQSVSIGGDRSGTVYIAYLVQQSGAFDDAILKIARSVNGGATWRIRTVVGGAGRYNAIRVIDEDRVLIATAESGAAQVLRLYATENGGRGWSMSTVDTFGWYTGLDTPQSGRVWLSYFNPGTTDLHAATSPSTNGPWETGVVKGEDGDSDFTGLGSSLDAARTGEVFIAYEDFQQARGRSVMRVSRSDDAGKTWSHSRVEASAVLGWNTSVRVLTNDSGNTAAAFTAYWMARGQPLRGQARLAHSTDGAAPWSVFRIPEHRYVEPYLDMAAPANTVQFVAYQVRPAERTPFLRLARVHVAD